MPIADTPSYIHPDHPRNTGGWTQYSGLTTRLRGTVFYSDILRSDDAWEYFDGSASKTVDIAQEQTPENYHGTHNHYQTVLYEVINVAPHANAVPVWGDGAAVVSGAAAWGGFFSARSGYLTPDGVKGTSEANIFGPTPGAIGPRSEFDCQLTGLEVDVLNGGKPGVFPNKPKHGVQIVGFNAPNSHALSIICENFNQAPSFRKGQFETGVYLENSIHPQYGRVLVGDFERAHIGIDFSKPVFKGGAIQIKSEGAGTGLVLNGGDGGEIFAGPREIGGTDERWLTIRMAEAGLRVLSRDGSREVLVVHPDGRISLNGEVAINGKRMAELIQGAVADALRVRQQGGGTVMRAAFERIRTRAWRWLRRREEPAAA